MSAVFEWKAQVQIRLDALQEDVDTIRSSRTQRSSNAPPQQPGGAAEIISETTIDDEGPAAADSKSFQLMKEFEDHETVFQRQTTKMSIDVARAETEKAMGRANQVHRYVCVCVFV